jgi:hypothetical protein
MLSFINKLLIDHEEKDHRGEFSVRRARWIYPKPPLAPQFGSSVNEDGPSRAVVSHFSSFLRSFHMLKMERNNEGRWHWTNHILRLASPEFGEVAAPVEGVCGERRLGI